MLIFLYFQKLLEMARFFKMQQDKEKKTEE